MTSQIFAADTTKPEDFIVRLIRGRRFSDLYGEVMEAVEWCAAYLDGEGRAKRATLTQPGQAAFARLSMWMTASLMRSASVVLVLRSVGNGEMDVGTAMRELEPTRKTSFATVPPDSSDLPEDFVAIKNEAIRVKEAADRFVDTLFGELNEPQESPVLRQIRELEERLSI